MGVIIKVLLLVVAVLAVSCDLVSMVTLCRHGSREALNDQYDGN